MTTCGPKFLRNRSRTIPSKLGTTKKVVNGQTVGTESYVSFSDYRTIQDWSTPCFRARFKAGEVINNGCTLIVTSSKTTGEGQAYFTKAGVQERWYGNVSSKFRYVGGPFSMGRWYRNPHPYLRKDIAKIRALSNVDTTPYEFIEDIGEIKDTLRFSMKPLQSLHTLSASFKLEAKKARRKNRLHRGRATASVWLSYRFAALPLLGSLYNIYESINTRRAPLPPVRTARGYYFEQIDRRNAIDHGSIASLRRFMDVWSECKAGISYRVYNPASKFRTEYGLRAKDIPKGLWQLMPLSFMVDRLVDISSSFDALRALSDPNVEFQHGWVTSKFSKTLTESLVDLSYDDSWVVPDSVEGRKFYYFREIWTPSYGDAVPTVNLSGLTNSLTKVTDLLALITQNFTGRS